MVIKMGALIVLLVGDPSWAQTSEVGMEIYWELRAREQMLELPDGYVLPSIEFPPGLKKPQAKFAGIASLYLADLFIETIWGEDDRQDRYEFCRHQCRQEQCKQCGSDIVRNMRAICLVLTVDDLEESGEDFYRLKSEWFTHYGGIPVCPGKFVGQRRTEGSSGVLVGKQLILMSGHQMKQKKQMRFVFGFHMTDAATPNLLILKSDVYQASDVDEGFPDWALVHLDRRVEDREPVPINRDDDIAVGTGVYYMGHPDGLPWKHGPNAHVLRVEQKKLFASLDAFNQTSGSPVFNGRTHRLEGIVLGTTDHHYIYMENSQGQVCRRYFQCFPSETGQPCEGFECARTTNFASRIPKKP